jgi:hypothetical protein
VIHKDVTSFVQHKRPLNTLTNIAYNFTSVTPVTGEKQKARKHYVNASRPSKVSNETQAQALLHMDDKIWSSIPNHTNQLLISHCSFTITSTLRF